MNAVYNFFLWLNYLIHYQGQCVAISGTPAHVVYGGSCIQSFLDALTSYGQIAWSYVP